MAKELQKITNKPTVDTMSVASVHENGGKGIVVTTETSLSSGLPTVILVGFAGKSLEESKERIRSAFSSSKIPLPKKRITVNMSPSDIPKDGAHYDLAIALSILGSANTIKTPHLEQTIVLGELGLDGSIKPVRGILGKLLCAMNNGYSRFIVPKANLKQARLIEGILLCPTQNLKEIFNKLSSSDSPFEEHRDTQKIQGEANQPDNTNFSEIIGQARAKRALEIAAAGGHNILLNGAPGVGKSMLAKAVPTIMPAPTKDQIITITHLHSLVGNAVTELIQTRPFRSPHHSSSDVSIIGGGQRPKPGEVSLAHEGVLFLDELPEFKRNTIESLRQPLEDGHVTVARAKDTATYPARFILVATKNPCPCGYYGSTKSCICSPIELDKYQKKLSGPIMDRIDIHVTVDSIEHEKLLSRQTGEENSETIRQRVEQAAQKQRKRLGLEKKNAYMNNRDIKKHIQLSSDAKQFLDAAAEKLDISARVYMKTVKLAQTICDLDNAEEITKNHIAEALQYRPIKEH